MRGIHSQSERTNTSTSEDGGRPTVVQRRVTELPVFTPPTTDGGTTGRVYGGGSRSANDGVFANLSAKPERGEKTEEQPPVSSDISGAQPCFHQLTCLR